MKKISNKIKFLIKNTRFQFDKLYIYKINLIGNKRTSNNFKIVKANSIDDLKEIIQERDVSFKRRYIDWFSKGIICFIMKEEKSTIGILWLANKKEVPLEFGCKQRLKNDSEAGIIDAYVLKEKRRKGVYKTLYNKALEEAQRLEIKTLYGYVLSNNIQSIKAHYKLGMKDVYQILYYFRILWFDFHFKRTFKNLKDISSLKNIELKYFFG